MIKKDVFIPLIKIGGTFSGGPGSFLVRPSDNSPGDYSLFFHINNQIQRFRIEKKGVRYVMGGRTFDALEAVINRYKTEQIVEGHSLGHHIRRVSRIYTSIDVNFKIKTAVAQQASKEVETSLVSDFSPVFYRYTNVFL